MKTDPVAHTYKAKGFTLIELLIVVAIIAILAAIAVPNFLEAQTRSKVSRVKADQRTMATALEAYMVDFNQYPPEQDPNRTPIVLLGGGGGADRCGTGEVGTNNWKPCEFANITLVQLTTPIAFLTSVDPTKDPFVVPTLSKYAGTTLQVPFPNQFYVNYLTRISAPWVAPPTAPKNKAWALQSLGPDQQDGGITNYYFVEMLLLGQPISVYVTNSPIYDPTNGTVSFGDITRFGGEIPADMQRLLNSAI